MKRVLAGLLLIAGLLIPAPAIVPASTAPSVANEAEQDQKFVASRKSTVYHRPDCRYVRQIKPGNLIGFKSKQEAKAAGYRACNVCRP